MAPMETVNRSISHYIIHITYVDAIGNPIGGLVFSDAFGQMEQLHEWTVKSYATYLSNARTDL